MSSSPISILNIVNPHACGGRCKDVIAKYESFLRKNRVGFHTYFTLEENNEPHIQKLIELYDFRVISIVGGDGTVNMAINALPNLSIPLHIIPAGSANDFAKMIYENNHLPTIFSYVFHSKYSKSIDVWLCNDKRFINGFGVGFDGAVAHAMEGKKYVSQRFKYWIELLKIIAGYNSYEMEIDGKKQKLFMVTAANGRVYGGSFNVAPNAVVDDQMLEVVFINKVSKLLRFRYLPRVQKGTHLDLNVVSYSRRNAITIRGDKPMKAHIDGEIVEDSHYVIRLEGRLQILA